MEKQEIKSVNHTFQPVYNGASRILILGTMPSPKSRELGFYYGHPRNRFWNVLSDVCEDEFPGDTQEKIKFCYRHRIAVWDVLRSCEIRGADDSSIRNPVANDMNVILKQADIQAVFTTGTKAGNLYKKYCFPMTKIPAISLPSTSPANCRTSYEALFQSYSHIMKYLKDL